MASSGRQQFSYLHLLLYPLRRRSTAGFTLLELVIVVAIAAILAAMAAPSFENSLNSSRMDTARNALAKSIKLARSEALTRKVQTVVCASSAGDSCDGGNDWAQGWMVFADSDANGRFSARNDVLLDVRDQFNAIDISVSSGGQFSFATSGALSVSGQRSVEFCSANSRAQVPGKRMLVATTGSVSYDDNARC